MLIVPMRCTFSTRAHAASSIHEIGEAARGSGVKLPKGWRDIVLHQLKHSGPARVLPHLERLAARVGTEDVQSKLSYLQKREAHM
ncbi:MAG TPA: hypothetical protein VKR06_08550 [Ktedonosporobacter sp.]|nr:hypothetical protein [Ktedonosporobacter sp.]